MAARRQSALSAYDLMSLAEQSENLSTPVREVDALKMGRTVSKDAVRLTVLNPNRYASALSLHPTPVEAVGEVAGEILERFDGALLDFNLAGELAEPLADFLIAHGVPFVFLTGYQRDSIDRRYANVPLLQKPIEPDSLERVLVSLLDTPAPLEAVEAD